MSVACDRDLDALLVALTQAPRVFVPVGRLPVLWGLPRAEALDLAAELEQEGWLSTWEPPAGRLSVILSTRAAERLGLELEPPDGEDLSACRWVKRGTARPPRAPVRPLVRCESDVWGEAEEQAEDGQRTGLDAVADHRCLDPAGVAEVLDDGPPPAKPRRSRPAAVERAVPRPRHFLGLDDQWPVAPDAGRCGACHGRRLPLDTYCLACEAAGVEQAGLMAVVSEPPRPSYRPSERAQQLAGGRGKAAPKKLDLVFKAGPKLKGKAARRPARRRSA